MTQPDPSEQTIETPKPVKVVPVTSRVLPWLASLGYKVTKYLVIPFYFGKAEVTGQENIPATGPVILAPTHRSRWDAFVVPHAAGQPVTGRDLRFMVSADEMKGWQGWFISRMGGFPVDTRNPGVGTFRHGVEVLRQGEVLVIFPEGGIYQDTQVHPLKTGLARIALQVESSQPELDVKIVPISVRYGSPVPHWGCGIKVNIGEPISVANYCSNTPKQSAKKLTADLEAALKQIDGCEVEEADTLSTAPPLNEVSGAQSSF
ncbi:1-acyl-sn-glycerol-3-phosphate acyltransferase [Coleofasciculus sp. FACHB-64]|uniref:lysophospholipid acyltransferase family protein n=1 Tax=Cyanophyceae TaxID=3028117 RepID=UPI00168320AD|nr:MULTISPECIES: 1-acyl-sn-glycerol-3-phosphate acyltransferase [unclassified Coleofasciculus]MBD1841536.1 1-acyl-sn-glycerol-3-phosphate acyltransferase [Coleofasciculus sp. FACHB-501]MBD1903205.1 1-acyl-sn-glycerol-3-phosphate acyltransferase [Coleofasciculus sp. FACHB-125]MBD2048962.1 1-acyl-sn-glycerol-3-phosphate acyltransferase [Coleofasciculus sp. FACHB-64]